MPRARPRWAVRCPTGPLDTASSSCRLRVRQRLRATGTVRLVMAGTWCSLTVLLVCANVAALWPRKGGLRPLGCSRHLGHMDAAALNAIPPVRGLDWAGYALQASSWPSPLVDGSAEWDRHMPANTVEPGWCPLPDTPASVFVQHQFSLAASLSPVSCPDPVFIGGELVDRMWVADPTCGNGANDCTPSQKRWPHSVDVSPCATLRGKSVLVIGDSYARHIFVALSLWLSGDYQTGALQTAHDPQCEGGGQFSEKVCRTQLARQATICGVVLKYEWVGLTASNLAEHDLIIWSTGNHALGECRRGVSDSREYAKHLGSACAALDREEVARKVVWVGTHARLKNYVEDESMAHLLDYHRTMRAAIQRVCGVNMTASAWDASLQIVQLHPADARVMSFDGAHWGMEINLIKIHDVLEVYKRQQTLSSAVALASSQPNASTVIDRKSVCASKLREKACVVYVLGSRLSFTFETEIVRRFGCVVHVFDCTLAYMSANVLHSGQTPRGFGGGRGAGIHLHPWCIGDRNERKPISSWGPCLGHQMEPGGPCAEHPIENGDYFTLAATMKKLRHESVDLLKVTSVWSASHAFMDVVATLTAAIAPRQLVFEARVDNFYGREGSMAKTDWLALWTVLESLKYGVFAHRPSSACMCEFSLYREKT